MNRDLPQMSSSAYSSNTLDYQGVNTMKYANAGFGLNQINPLVHLAAINHVPTITQEKPMSNARRLVRVIIVDPNENVPLDKAILFKGEERFTDLTDQELFFEVEIASLLQKHNEERVKLQDKAIKDRAQMLDAARIRDLKMVVVSVAGF